jgi:amino acid adenylation domain-containing protein
MVWMQRTYQLSPQDKVLQKTPYSFDVSIWETFWTLTQGSTLVVAKPNGHKDPVYLTELIVAQQITLVHFVPSMLDVMLQSDCWPQCTSVKDVFCSGEALSKDLQTRFFAISKQCRLRNLYGPTEAAIGVSYWDCDRTSTLDEVPIGRPIQNASLLVLDQHRQLQPLGAPGEMYIGGVGLARGYLNKDKLTSEAFIDNPFPQIDGSRLYKTGDLVRYDRQGNIYYLGRIDHQVKIRGLRIELGEIEFHLTELPQVSSALVMALTRDDGEQYLVAYVAPAEQSPDEQAFIEQLQRDLSQSVPEYMVPKAYKVVLQWPVTSNGKVDRKSLATMTPLVVQGKYITPSTATEIKLAQLWADLLQLAPESIGAGANFFDLGGHSLLSIRLIAQIRSQFGVELSVKTVFEQPIMADLAKAIEQCEQQAVAGVVKLDPRPQRLSLSYAQQRLWFIDQLENGGSGQYNMPLAFEICGLFDITAAQQAISNIIVRHEVLHTVYREDQEGAYQLPMPQSTFELALLDLSHLNDEQQHNQLLQLLNEDALKPFDLANDLMVRALFIQLDKPHSQAGGKGVLSFNMHHIASDGWSMGVLMREFVRQYRAVVDGKADPLPPLEVQYVDYAHWQRQWLQGETLDNQLGYWKKQLDGIAPVHGLLLDKPRPAVNQHRGAVISGRIPADTATALQNMAQQFQLTPFMLMHGAFALLLCRHSHSNDIVIGTPVANRMRAELEPLIGFFVNTLVLRLDTSAPQLTDYFAHLRDVHLQAQMHQDVPFEQLVESLNVSRTTAHAPLFQIMLTMGTDNGDESQDEHELTLPGATLRPLEPDSHSAKFDLNLNVTMDQHGVELHWTYDCSLFEQAHISRLNQQLTLLLSDLAALPDPRTAAIGELKMLPSDEQTLLLETFNATEQPYPDQQLIHHQFEAQVLSTPDAIAVIFEHQQLSYRQLNLRANQLAHWLIEQGIGTDQLVALCLERSIEMVVAIVAVLKAGGAYVPMDPDLPLTRIQYMLEDTVAGVLLSQSHLTAELAMPATVKLFLLDDEDSQQQLNQAAATNPLPSKVQDSQSLAYVIYTSGSTGEPKGVMCHHQGLVNRIDWMQRTYQLSSEDKVLQKTPYSFDVSVWEFLWPLRQGGTLVVAKPSGHKDPAYLAELIVAQQITLLHFVPSMLDVMLQSGCWQQCDTVREVFCSGEALSKDVQQRFYAVSQQCRLHNLYGPTEAAIDVSYWACERDSILEDVPIGKPIQNTALLVLDQHQGLQPLGAPGELYIGGAGLARGYLNKDQLTNEAFIANPFTAIAGDRLYKTGDLARFDLQGNIHYLGRIDHQVKIRGLRIELAEIEYHLAQLPQVSSAVVMALSRDDGEQYLVAYVIATDPLADEQPFIEQLHGALTQPLPEYMVPKAYTVVSQWPVTANGKVDRKLLASMETLVVQGKYIEPSTATEIKLAQLWADLLQLAPESIGAGGNFFDLGGHSLLVVQLVTQMRELFGLEVKIKDVFEQPTIGQLAETIDSISSINLVNHKINESVIVSEGFL